MKEKNQSLRRLSKKAKQTKIKTETFLGFEDKQEARRSEVKKLH